MTNNPAEQAKAAILETLKNIKGESFNICHVLYEILTHFDFPVQVEAFQYTCEIYGTIESHESFSAPISDYFNQKDNLEEQYGDIVNGLIKTYSRGNTEEGDFYRSLWSIIHESLLFDTEAKKIFAMYYILIDKRIPYFKLDTANMYSMSGDRFSQLQDETAHEAQRIRFIIKTEIGQKTERASLLLHEMGIPIPAEEDPESIKAYEKRLMQMVYILRNSGGDSDRVRALLSLLKK